MPKPYSHDLRKKVIDAIKLDGMPITEASEVFQISRNTIYLWLKRQEEMGHYQPLPHCPPGHSHKITDWEAFRQFVAEHGDKTQAEMAALWPEDISPSTLSRGLAKLGLTSNRKSRVIGNGRQKNKPKRSH